MHEPLTAEESRDLRAFAGTMIPASPRHGVPGADDDAIFAEIERSLERDRNDIALALKRLATIAGGAFADTRDRRKVLIVTQALLGSFSAVLAIATAAGNASVALIYVLTLLTATASCFDDPARAALIPNLVPRRHLAQALTLRM